MITISGPPRKGIIIMGVSGCGKSTVGRALAEKLGSTFLDADDFHPPQNIEKMKLGIPLEDADRWEWLDATAHTFANVIASEPNSVLACSALKETYRERIETVMSTKVNWVLLDGSRELLLQRLSFRKGHFFDPKLLDSQIKALEIPMYARKINIDRQISEIVVELMQSKYL